jgi:Tfp pilus assembly protein PilF
VITSQAPTNGAFNWGMVLAHELAHVFALQLSRSRVPRWFTEGLSELETAHMRPEWRRHGELSLWAALSAGALAPMEKLSQSFVRARDAEAASTAYMHAAVAVEYLERRFGFPKIREALVAFGRGDRVAVVLQELSGGSVAALERAFRDDLTAHSAGLRDQFLPAHAARFAVRGPARAEATPRELAESGLAQLYDGDARAARATLAKALLKKGGREDPTASFLTAELAIQGGETATASEELRGLLASNHDGYDVRLRLAVTSLRNDDEVSTEKHLRRAVELAPTEVEPRLLLMELYDRLGRDKDRQREAEALLLLEPQSAKLAQRVVLEAAAAGRPDAVVKLAPIASFIDPADAKVHAALGRALMGMGRTREARAAFERALRFAPGNPIFHRTLADVLDKLGETSQATVHRRAATADAGADR